jgi:hypothetical protein
LYETDLYAPVKKLFKDLGFTVKAEIGAADVVARRGDDPPVIIELKLSFTLTLLHQAIARQSMSDSVYVAVPKWKGRAGWKTFKGNISLCRRLGLGLISVDIAAGTAKIYCDPASYQPRKSKTRMARLKSEFDRRKGDPNTGGSTRRKIMTAYRQEAIRCAIVLKTHGPGKGSDIAKRADVSRATRLMADNHYGWFVRIGRGIYDLTPEGLAMLEDRNQ